MSPSHGYITVSGSPAWSDARCRAIAERTGIIDLRSQWLHHVWLDNGFSEDKRPALEQILTYRDVPYSTSLPDSEPEASHKTSFFISPRTGTVSPWSSSATSIANVCLGRGIVKRIERSMLVNAIFKDRGQAADSLILNSLHDRMTQSISHSQPDLSLMFSEHHPLPLETVSLEGQGRSPMEILNEANVRLGLALDESELQYLVDAYANNGPVGRPPTDVELFMFAQVNSEHCRHKQFNATWTIDGQKKPNTLFGMIRNTHKQNEEGTVSAYSDNAAVLQGFDGSYWAPDQATGTWLQTRETVHFLAKVETHNHPTAVSPFPGAATGSGGEIRDEGAVGRGSKPKAGLSGFTVSDLLLPGQIQPWELQQVGKPNHIASALDIMIEAPLGSAAFNNEFGRPCTTGYFRTLLTQVPVGDNQIEFRGYHKPIMLAGGVGTVRPQHALKDPQNVRPGSFLIVLGGPAMLIGLGGGAASSMSSGEGSVDLDFASVQRGNAEVQRRAQEVINACSSMGVDSPIKFIHDVGAGGLSNALPELVHDSDLGATFELREIDNVDKGMSPLQIWCCEAQERYVMAVSEDGLNKFRAIATRERCGYSVVGKATGTEDGEKRLILMDRDHPQHTKPIDLPMSVLFGKPPKMTRTVQSRKLTLPKFDKSLKAYLPSSPGIDALGEAVDRVLKLPSVGSKSFLITIGDRTVGGLTARDQMVGPWQTPVADVSVTATSLTPGIKTGEAMAMGEKPTLALISPAASARMAVAEALMNLTAADLPDRRALHGVKLSANWMCASSHPGEGAAIYEAVEAIGLDLCPKLGISIPVGKDSMSMKMKWKDQKTEEQKEVTAPLSLVISAFAPVANIKNTWTPALRRLEDVGETSLFFVDLALGRKSLGGSALAQVFRQVGDVCPDVHNVSLFRDFFDATQQLQEDRIVLAYHDRSDGGLLTTLVEMMFAGRCGVEIMLDGICPSPQPQHVIETLFNEELGAVFQVRKSDENRFRGCFSTSGPPDGLLHKIGRVSKASKQELVIYHGLTLVYRQSRSSLQQKWAFTSHEIQKLRDNPGCADTEHNNILNDGDPGLSYNLRFSAKENIIPWKSSLSTLGLTNKPRVAILREQGVNGQAEMAYGFNVAGFQAVDVHMTDLISGRVSLSAFRGLAACGGFSYGDVLGAGQGWAKSVLLHPSTRKEFQSFFARPDTFTLGVCNGCQFLSRLSSLIPDAATSWPVFERNESEQYEARVCMVKITDPDPSSPSVFLHGMDGSSLPIAVAHGEGRATFESTTLNPLPPSEQAKRLVESGLAPLQYVDNTSLQPTQTYPFNPNGSPEAIAGVRSKDGRVLALMPHPERTVLSGIGSYIPDHIAKEWDGEIGPWGRLFQSARRWVG